MKSLNTRGLMLAIGIIIMAAATSASAQAIDATTNMQPSHGDLGLHNNMNHSDQDNMNDHVCANAPDHMDMEECGMAMHCRNG